MKMNRLDVIADNQSPQLQEARPGKEEKSMIKENNWI